MRVKRFRPMNGLIALLSVALLSGLVWANTVLAWVPAGAPASSLAAAPTGSAPGSGASSLPGSAIYRGVSTAVHFDVSPPLRSMRPAAAAPGPEREVPEGGRSNGVAGAPSSRPAVDPFLQLKLGPFAMPTPLVSFDGINNISGVSPPDPVGAVGPNHYVHMSNLSFAIYNKTGTVLFGPALNNTLWAGFGGPCQVQNAGDPVVEYDQMADRWLLTQFTSSGTTFYNCAALSQTSDPTGAYYRWAFSTGANFPDYPKYGLWPDAYYISTREFQGGPSGPFAGVGAYAVNRAQMIAGSPSPQMISFLAPPTPLYTVGDGLLPTYLDGATLPPAGSPNYYVGSMDDGGGYGATQDALTLWKFHVDFGTPTNSTFTLANTIPTAPFDSTFTPCGGTRNCIAQPGTTNRIDILSYRQRPTWRLAYRNYGSHESLVTNQSVAGGTGPSGVVAGIRWYELRSPNSSPIIFQQGTYAPGVTDGIHRWMGSIAMDRDGNMGLAYSASSGTVFPSLRYTGRLAGDAPGTMPQGEASIIDGTGSQTGSQRWGDYTSLNVDPTDDCTFWYVNEYVPTTSSVGWRTRMGSFKFPSCVAPTPTSTPTSTRTPVPPTHTPTATPTGGAATPTSTATACTITFTDVQPSDYFYEPVRYLYCHGAISGYGDNTFRPGNLTTRGQLSKIVVLAVGWTIYTPPAPTFSDVPTTNAFYQYIETAYNHGIISGYTCGTGCLEFRPNNNVTRAQLCKIVVLAKVWTLYTPPSPTFQDVLAADPFYQYIETAYNHGIISGYTCGTGCLEFRPGNNATRGQIAKIVYLAVTATAR
jgi:hypothetical protein